MDWKRSTTPLVVGVCAAALCASTFSVLKAQAPAAPPGQAAPARGGGAGRGAGGRGGGVAPGLFTALDLNKDGSLTRDEMKLAFATWFLAWDGSKSNPLTEAQIATGLTAAMPAPAAPAAGAGFGGGGRGAQNEVPKDTDMAAMMAALPDKAYAKPLKPRKVLVLGKAQGFVHSSIPLAAKTVEAIGNKTKAWTTTITYNPADINTENLKQYDAVFLSSTTGCFLDEPGDPAATAARRAALLAFVRGGKGLAGIHAATDSYHGPCPNDPRPADAAAGGGRAGGRGAAGGGAGAQVAMLMVSQGDKNGDMKLSSDELLALGDAWFDKLDTDKSGKVSAADFATRFAALTPAPAVPAGGRGAGAAPPQGPDHEVGSWPEFNHMIGGFFKFHWVDPQLITVKIDDPKSPLTQMFHGQEFEIHDETYTMGIASWSRENVHVLTSIDYSKMSDADKAKESYPRADHDYGLSWIRKEGMGRVFYEAHGHSERIYAMPAMLQHVMAGIQYALGDLKADDSPSVKPKK